MTRWHMFTPWDDVSYDTRLFPPPPLPLYGLRKSRNGAARPPDTNGVAPSDAWYPALHGPTLQLQVAPYHMIMREACRRSPFLVVHDSDIL